MRDLHGFEDEQGRPRRILTSMFAPKRPLPVAVDGPMRQNSAHHSVAAQIVSPRRLVGPVLGWDGGGRCVIVSGWCSTSDHGNTTVARLETLYFYFYRDDGGDSGKEVSIRVASDELRLDKNRIARPSVWAPFLPPILCPLQGQVGMVSPTYLDAAAPIQ